MVGCLGSIINNDPFASLRSIQNRIHSELQCTVSIQLIRSVIKSMGFTKKKARFQGRPCRVQEHTSQFVTQRDALLINGHQCVSLDETSFGRRGSVTYGYSKKGNPLFVKNKPSRITTTSALSAVSPEGKVYLSKRYGSFNRNTFLEALESFSFPKGTVVLLNNVAFHHSRCVKEYARGHDIHLLYVPAYSPWFNPIEGGISVVKRHFYKHRSIDKAFANVTPQHTDAFFKKSFALQSSPVLLDL